MRDGPAHPFQIGGQAARRRQNDNCRHIIGVKGVQSGDQLICARGQGFQQQDNLLATLHGAIPFIDGNHAGQDIGAGRKPCRDNLLRGLFRALHGWKGRIDKADILFRNMGWRH